MIEVDRLSKTFGSHAAIRDMSFRIGKGEVVGFLGPNGAGKTTTMRILTTYLEPSTGIARLNGHDVLDEPLGVRRSVGYLPETVPLYPEMRTLEFLRFKARLKRVPRRHRRAVLDHVMQRCGLEEVSNQILGHLSKGFRQRVGLADALLNDPPILILDEPTSGLDPLQVREVRELIKDLGTTQTVLLSTHILPEVEAVCSRALIVAQGRIALDETMETGTATGSLVVEARNAHGGLTGLLETLPGVRRVRQVSRAGDVWTCQVWPATNTSPAPDDLREQIAHRLVQNGWGLRRLEPARSTLEDRFVAAVSRALDVADSEPEPAVA